MSNISLMIKAHYARYPAMQVQDLYKLLHQAAMGSEHAVHDGQTAHAWLRRELEEMGAGPDDPLFDPLSPDGQILRIHLRPYLRERRDPEKLLQAFILTTNDWHGSKENLKEYAAFAVQQAKEGIGSIRPAEIESFFDKMEAQGFPAIHHSEVYQRIYHPAYRVVARQFLEEK